MLSEDTLREALTFDDVLLVPAESDVLPRDVQLHTRLTNSIPLQIPLVSSAMDTVTEAATAICMAREGGIGIIHKNFSIQEQATEVQKVKKAESGVVVDPVTINPEQKLATALETMRRYNISGLPVVDDSGRAVGIVTNRDVRFEKNLEQKVRDVMTTKLITAPEGIPLEQSKELLHKNRIEKLIVVDGAGRLKGLITIKERASSRSRTSRRRRRTRTPPRTTSAACAWARPSAWAPIARRASRRSSRPASTSSASTPRTATRAA
jgi:IMP dehydrogenase